jgi:anthranilate phosphoribosyltransferase
MEAMKPLIAELAKGASLSRSDAERAFDQMLSGEATPAQIGAFLMALRVRGETVDEIIGAVSAMRAKMLRVNAPDNAIDIVGTGGDNSGSYNVSTLAALIVASCGVTVAKHGNRALSSKSGAADILTALGVKVGLDPAGVEQCLKDAHVGFMFAPTHHAAMRHVGPVRVELGTRTIFNLLGPLSNPAGVKRQLLGVYSDQWLEPLAKTLTSLGTEYVWAVHGTDGLDEITTTTETKIVEAKHGVFKSFVLTPEDAGLKRAKPEDLKGGDATHNAKALMNVLEGQPSAYRDIAAINAGAALVIAEKVSNIREGVTQALAALDQGKTKETLARLVKASNA